MMTVWVAIAVVIATVMTYITSVARIKIDYTYPKCIPLDLNRNICDVRVTAIGDNKAHKIVPLEPYTNIIGDVLFGDRIVPGDCDYNTRIVYIELEDDFEVIKIETRAHDGTTELLEYVGRPKEHDVYLELNRIAIDINLNDATFPEHVMPMYNIKSRSTDIKIKSSLKNQYRIGTVIIGEIKVPDTPCISRYIKIQQRHDGRKLVSVLSKYPDNEHISSYIEQGAGKLNFVPYNKDTYPEDIRIGSYNDIALDI
ncbi:putative integral membrane protein [Babesia bovis T2Bo]|uniref:Membrane protein, putative n=1 Tax=Babesia bovis TaxID=5865 RepID=A7ANA7_BABBO|nr:putative integral membrane protein [Babesia bovis T2Bo]EDO08041.1 putative integral membrane protein [Babesia bovis T2Bo]|eukprot:XP_001611609.1 membrane protein [Babesia bovis T2Bo]